MTQLQRDLAGLTRHQRHLLRTNVYWNPPPLVGGRVRSLRAIANRHGEEV